MTRVKPNYRAMLPWSGLLELNFICPVCQAHLYVFVTEHMKSVPESVVCKHFDSCCAEGNPTFPKAEAEIWGVFKEEEPSND